MKKISYEEAVKILRNRPNGQTWARDCYLEDNVISSAERFGQSEEFEAVASLLDLKKRQNLQILDLGCGNGIASYAIAQLGHHVTALDPDLSEIVGLGAAKQLSKNLSAGTIRINQSFAESLQLEDSSYDLIYSRQALHHFNNLEQSMCECYRVLRKHGLLLATREHIAETPEELKSFLKGHVLHQLHGGENAYPESYYVDCFKQAGFKILKIFRTYNTVINYYPLKDIEFDQLFLKFLKNKVGSSIASNLVLNKFIKKLYRKHLSKVIRTPGRPYSFLCRKR